MREPSPRPIIVDCTLRDGEQAPGVAFALEDKLRIVRLLVGAGIRDIEAGIPAMGADEARVFTAVADAAATATDGLAPRLIAWNRMRRGDAEASIRAGATTLHLSVPVSEFMLESKLHWSRHRALEETKATVTYCLDRGVEVIVGAEDASRADPAFLLDIFGVASDAGAFRVRYADTLGAQDPFQVKDALGTLVQRLGVQVEYHGHNDLGLAAANALAAFDAGAAVSVTVNGLGERAGNAPLEQVASMLSLLRHSDAGIDLLRLPSLAAAVAAASARPIPADRPLTGSAVFSHESGIHVDGLLKDPTTYEFVQPSMVGRQRSFVPGRHSGRTALRLCASLLGHDLVDEALEVLRDKVAHRWAAGAPSDPWRAFAELLDSEDF